MKSTIPVFISVLVSLINYSCITNQELEGSVTDYYVNKDINIKPQLNNVYRITHNEESVFGTYCKCSLDTSISIEFIKAKNAYKTCMINPRLITKPLQFKLDKKIAEGKLDTSGKVKKLEIKFKELPSRFYFKARNQTYGGVGSGFLPLDLSIAVLDVFNNNHFVTKTEVMAVQVIFIGKNGETVGSKDLNYELKKIDVKDFSNYTTPLIKKGLKYYTKEFDRVYNELISAILVEIK